MKTIAYLIILTLFIGCTITTKKGYLENQSEFIARYRSFGFYEHSSRLNDSMWSVLNGYRNNLISNATYHKIVETSKKVKTEKPTLGCYLIDWNDNPYDTTSKILLEWNLSEGVIIRFFTTSEEIKKRLPDQSF
ncbi:hypothetical protein VP395_14545 [Mariniflexile soesokkakense]|uniref:Lipoprotein n=1 Tax=Mariniflexile soesokkakense TaxID=1343160 RepID=A0ABV0AGD3_9FLAO